MTDDALFRLVADRPWALAPDAAAALVAGGLDSARSSGYRLAGGVAFVPVRGPLINRGSWLSDLFGFGTYDKLRETLGEAAADPLARGIVLDMDSPGGEAAGAFELAAVVREISERKPVIAYINSVAASAAYWIASGASEIVVTPTSTVGSIGIVWLHLDHSQALADLGVKPTLLHAGAHKIDGAETHPLDPGARRRIQAQLDGMYSLFLASVGEHRPKLGEAGARATKAGLYMGTKAVAAKLADRVGTIETAVERVAAKPRGERQATKPIAPPAAAAAPPPPSIAAVALPSPPPPRAPQPKEHHMQTDDLWNDILARHNAKLPKGAFIPAHAPRDPPAASRSAPQARKMTQPEIDGMYAEIAGRLNATLPARAWFPHDAPGARRGAA